MDCEPSGSGCSGGSIQNALLYIKNAGGLTTSAKYPYKAVRGKCLFNKNMAAVKVSGYYRVPSNENSMVDALLKYGPLASAMDANKLQFYSKGVYTCYGAISLDHAVTIIGYGYDNTGLYWIIKNSWGATWGMNGYFYLRRGINACGIANYVIAALLP
jgi:cathepsin F